MKILILILTLTLTSCSFKDSKETKNRMPLNYIESYSTLRLVTVDERCGEWGGDEEVITVYRDLRQEIFYADYVKKVINCDEPYADSSKNNMRYRKRIVMDLDAQNIAKQCVDQLVEFKLNNRLIPSHSGIYNSVFVSDSSFIIKDYPSRNWSLFFKLRDKLIGK